MNKTDNNVWKLVFAHPYDVLAFLAGLVLLAFAAGVVAILLVRMGKGTIDLSKLISEPSGDASLSRLQFLIFTFIIGLSLFIITVGTTPPGWPKVFPAEILTLLGISGSSYLVSKAIQSGATAPTLLISGGPTAPLAAGATAQFTVSSSNAGSPAPQVTWSLDAPSEGTIVPNPPDKVTYTAPNPSPGAGTKVILRAQAGGFEDGLFTITLA
jgi:hypothetical protein